MLAKFVVHKLQDHAGVLNILNIQCDHLSPTQALNRTSNYQSPSQTESVKHSQPGCQQKSNWWNGVDESSSSFWGKGSAPPEQGSSGWGEKQQPKKSCGVGESRGCGWELPRSRKTENSEISFWNIPSEWLGWKGASISFSVLPMDTFHHSRLL